MKDTVSWKIFMFGLLIMNFVASFAAFTMMAEVRSELKEFKQTFVTEEEECELSAALEELNPPPLGLQQDPVQSSVLGQLQLPWPYPLGIPELDCRVLLEALESSKSQTINRTLMDAPP